MPTYVYTIKNNPLMGYFLCFYMSIHMSFYMSTRIYHRGLTFKKLDLYTINAEKGVKSKKDSDTQQNIKSSTH